MTFDEFARSTDLAEPPAGLGGPLLALWRDRRGDFDGAHQIAQDNPGREGDWVHAYLHRKEGDSANAAYWYRRAGRPFPVEPVSAEWARIARTLLTGDD